MVVWACLPTRPEPSAKDAPAFSFGIITDVQWADVPDGSNFNGKVKRHFRGALQVLSSAVAYWNWNALDASRLAFVAQLGDLADGRNARLSQSDTALQAALSHLRRSPCRVVSLLGNHDLSNFDRQTLALKLTTGLRGYHALSPAPGWRVIVLDAFEESVGGRAQGDERRTRAEQWLAKHNPNDLSDGGAWFRGLHGTDRRAVPYNGAFVQPQLRWLRRELRDAAVNGERVIILSHVVLSPEACDGTTVAWDYDEALAAIRESRPVVAMVVCGHDHNGGYFYDAVSSVHHLTLSSPLNLGTNGHAYGLIEAYADRIELHGPRLDDLLPSKSSAWPDRPPTTTRMAKSGGAAGPGGDVIRFRL